METEEKKLFELGKVMITRGASDEIVATDIWRAVACHSRGDWGQVVPEDWEANDAALRLNDRLFSVYHDRIGTKFYVITEHDRSVTTVLLPEEY